MQKKILIIEDEEDVRSSIVEILDSAGHKPIQAADGIEALKLLENEIPDLVISDIMMPGLNGYAVLEHFQKMNSTSNVPFIFLSAKGTCSDVRLGMIRGADDYITKPFRVKDLLQSIETQLKKRDKINVKFESIYNNISAYIPHELLTPLIPILGYPELLIERINDFSREEILDMLDKIKGAGNRLQVTIRKFLKYTESRIRLADNSFNKTSGDENLSYIGPEIKEYCIIEGKKFKREKDLEFEIEEGHVKIFEGDLTFVIGELIDNALKFSVPGSKINITGKISDNMYKLEITDHGRGIKPEQLNNIYPFIQHDRKIFQNSGNGLGLVTIKNILEFYSGHLKLSSSVNEYTRCSIDLPLAEIN